MKKLIALVVIAAALGFAYYTISPYWRNIEMDEASPLAALEPSTGTAGAAVETAVELPPQGELAAADFVAMAHEVEGSAKLIRVGDEVTLRFEDFKSINGPDLNIYLSTDKENTEFIDLGDIKATSGNVNYTVPSDVDLTKYDTVLVWCKAFSVLFSYAELNVE